MTLKSQISNSNLQTAHAAIRPHPRQSKTGRKFSKASPKRLLIRRRSGPNFRCRLFWASSPDHSGYDYQRRSKREAVPNQSVSRKLLKELAKQKISASSGWREALKLLARGENESRQSIDNPHVFRLCPSVFTDAVSRRNESKSDRKVCASPGKLGLLRTRSRNRCELQISSPAYSVIEPPNLGARQICMASCRSSTTEFRPEILADVTFRRVN